MLVITIKIIILAAGYGTRLYPLTLDKPKAFLDIGGITVLDLIMDRLREVKTDGVYVVTNDKFYDLFSEWSRKYEGVRIINDKTRSNEERLGAVGDLKYAIDNERIDDDIVVINSDNVFLFPFKPIFDKFNGISLDMLVLYDVKTKEEASKMGIAKLDDYGNMVYFEEKPKDPSTTLVSIGFYMYKRETVKLLDRYKSEGGRMEGPGFFNAWLTGLKKVNSYIVEGDDKWFDIGTKEIYDYVYNLKK